MKCEDLLTYLNEYIENNLSEELSVAAQKHLATCDNCRVVLSSTQQMILLYREHGQTQQIPKERQEKLYQNLQQAFLQKPKPE